MQSYYFIKYDHFTTIEHLCKFAETKAILCFDLEDSINKTELKPQYRNYFVQILENLLPQVGAQKIGLRINSNAEEFDKDADTIADRYINFIFIPKVENIEQINLIFKRLSENNVSFDELIPIIETKNGLTDLPDIIKNLPGKINKIAFGHCDYNFSINAYPFFHQDTMEYWKWIHKLNEIITPNGLSLVNSPYLDLNNHSFFQSMINYLYEYLGNNFGQITLSSKQSEIIRNFEPKNNKLNFKRLIDNRLNLCMPLHYDHQIIEAFANENHNRGFTVIQKNRIIISPQEYRKALDYRSNKKSKTFNFTIVGGCFPVQHDILFEDTYHQRFKRKIEKVIDLELNVNIVRYSRLITCFKKIVDLNKKVPIDILIFHVRPEPYLRIVKLYYKYMNYKGIVKHSFNIPLLKMVNPEKYDCLVLGRRYIHDIGPDGSKFHKRLINLNYKAGDLLGNKKYALKAYVDLISDISEYCKNSGKKFILLGPAYRSNTSYEATLCEDLNTYIKQKLNSSDIIYIECLEKSKDKNKPFFQANGIHASECFHEYVADKMFDRLKPVLENMVI
jgi:hypothetical protein